MELSADQTRYLAWAGAVAIGALLAILERRWTRWPALAALLLAGVGPASW
jgi:hypothetical protein